MNYDLTKLTNTEENKKIAQHILSDGNYNPSVLTHYDGKIYACNPLIDGGIDKSSWLMDVKQFYNVGKLVAAGGSPDLLEKNQNSIFSQDYQTILDEAKKQKKLIDKNPGIKPYRLIAGAGPTIETAYENVRRVNYIRDIVGPQYVPTDYNAINAVDVENVSDLNFLGFFKSSSLLQGVGQIGDHAEVPLAEQAFTSYEVSLYADAFRYEFSQREKKDSVPNLEAEIRREIPGLFARMKDERIATALNAVTDAGAIGTDWDTISGNFFTGDAAGDIQDDEDALDTYGKPLVAFMPSPVFRLYAKNVQAAISAVPAKSVSSTSPGRTGTLMANPAVQYFIHSTITAAAYVVVAKGAWRRLFKGPDINISYKNSLTAGQVEGRITFDFNVLSGDIIAGAARLRSSVT